jgi:hypothetical protein
MIRIRAADRSFLTCLIVPMAVTTDRFLGFEGKTADMGS